MAREWMKYRIGRKYPHGPMKRAGARLYYWRPKDCWGRPLPARWVFCLRFPAENGDGGVVLVFERAGKNWVLMEMGRLRHSHEPARTVYAAELAALT